MDRWSQGGALSSSLPPQGTEESSSYSSGEDDFSPSGVSADRRERGHSPRREGRRRTTMTARRDFSSPELLGRWRSAHNLPRLLPDRRRHHRSLDHAASSPLLGPSRAPSVLRSALKTTALLFLPVALFFAYLEWRDPTGGGLPGSGGASWAGAGKGGGGRASSVIMAGGKYQLAVLDFGGGAFEHGGGVRSAKPPLPTAEMRWSPRVRRRGGEEEETEEALDASGSRLQQRQMVPLDVSTAPRRDEETSQTAMAAPPPFPRGMNVQPSSHARNRVKAASAVARKKGGGKNAGWIPSAFPNPRDDPGRCGLVAGGVVVPSGGTGGGGASEIPAAYGGMTFGGGGGDVGSEEGGGSAANDEHNSAENSREEEVAPKFQDEQAAAANGEEGSDGDDDDNDNDESDVSPEDDHRRGRRRRFLQPAVAENPLAGEETPLLCDPDEVLGYVYMNQVADALRKFREKYGPRRRPIPLGHPNGASKGESGGCSDSGAAPSAEPKEKNTDEGTEWEVEALPPSPPGTVLGTEPGVPLPAIEWEVDDEGNDAGGAGGGGFEIAVAVSRRMDLPSVLRVADSYYSYEDEDDLVNDAAQYFARYLHDAWWAVADDNDDDGNGAPSEEIGSGAGNADDGGAGCGRNGTAATTATPNQPYRSPPVDGVLLFLSVQDRVCFVSTGPTSSSSDSSGSSSRSVLPWWRLERVVSSMRPSLRRSEYGPAVLGAISDISALLDAGPPDLAERSRDFVERFGVVIVFAAFTFAMAAWGEYRDRNRRYQYAEARSKMTPKEEEAANALRERFGERSCPICLEEFPPPFEEVDKDKDDGENKEEKDEVEEKRVSSPTDGPSVNTSPSSRSTNPRGSDGKPLKLLRCGHVFDRTCWRHWVDSGQGDPCLCPVCRRDVGGKDARDKSKYAGPAGETSAAAAEPSVQLDRGARGQHQQGQRHRRRRRRRRNREARIADMASGAAAAERGDGDHAAEEASSSAAGAAASAASQPSMSDATATASAPRRRRGYDTLPQASAADSEGPDQRIQSGLLVSFLSRRWPRVQPRWRRRRVENDDSPRLTSAATEETALLGDEESPAAAGSL